jgi:hypothetical protein
MSINRFIKFIRDVFLRTILHLKYAGFDIERNIDNNDNYSINNYENSSVSNDNSNYDNSHSTNYNDNSNYNNNMSNNYNDSSDNENHSHYNGDRIQLDPRYQDDSIDSSYSGSTHSSNSGSNIKLSPI